MVEIKMVKNSISRKQKKSETKFMKEHTPFKSKVLKNKSVVSDALVDCLKTGDLQTFREVLFAHLMTVNKAELAKKAGIGRRTLYDLIDPKKEFNPELSTISAILQALAA